jgi:ligand-binding SRPBCC domain-containing protein
MKYSHRFQVKAPLARVASFHQDHANMAAITPPPINVELHRVPPPLTSGELEFTLRFGPFPIHWLASIEDLDETGFTDRQLRGPFASWVHRHAMRPIDDQTTEIIDEIAIKLKKQLVWGLVGFGFYLGLPFLFAFRTWKTRRLLQAEAT